MQTSITKNLIYQSFIGEVFLINKYSISNKNHIIISYNDICILNSIKQKTTIFPIDTFRKIN